jgi:hypothetical protein
MSLKYVAASAVALALTSPSLLAHHGWSGQGTETFELNGTLHSPLQLAGPHASMRIKDKTGQVWDLTLSAAPRVEATGLKADTIPVGAPVTISGKRNLDKKKFEVKTERIVHAGRTYEVYAGR